MGNHNMVHVNYACLFIPFCSRRGNNFLSDGKLLECLKKGRECNVLMILSPKLTLKLVEVDGTPILNDDRDKSNIC